MHQEAVVPLVERIVDAAKALAPDGVGEITEQIAHRSDPMRQLSEKIKPSDLAITCQFCIRLI